MNNIGIIGYGIVGKATALFFKHHRKNISIKFYDPKNPDTYSFEEVVKESKFIFVCVPTPCVDINNNPRISVHLVEQIVGDIVKIKTKHLKHIIIKSSVTPGTTKELIRSTGYSNIYFSPEFLTESIWMFDAINPKRHVIGAEYPCKVNEYIRSLENINKDIPIYRCDTVTAEATKYFANSLGAIKVIYANVMKQGFDKLGVDYEKLVEIVTADPMYSAEHLKVSNARGFGGKCLPKDMRSIIGLFKDLDIDTSFLESAWENNLRLRKKRDWEDIEGAIL